jgi:uncharacterized protein (DUF4415 family)
MAKLKKTSTSDTKNSDDWYPTDEEFAQFRPIEEVDPALLAAFEKGTLRRRGRPALPNKREVVSLRLEPEIISAFRASGAGWQTRINALLREHMPR